MASFEATVGGSGCPRLVEFFKKISMNARWVPFCVEYLPPNEESRSSGRQGNKKRPLSTSPTKRGAHKNWGPCHLPKTGRASVFLDMFACYGIFRFPTMTRILGRYPTPHGQEFERAFIRARTEDSRKRALPRTRFVRVPKKWAVPLACVDMWGCALIRLP